MARFKLYFVIFLTLNVYNTYAQISDKRLCGDPECTVPVATGITIMSYASPHGKILPFKPHEQVTIYSKHAGSNEDLWGVEINGKRGYAPRRFIKEERKLLKATFLVDTELLDSNTPEAPKKAEQILPDQPSYEVIAGTTIPIEPQNILPTSTETPVLSTTLPPDIGASAETTSTLPEHFNLVTSSETTEELPVIENQAVNVSKSDNANDATDDCSIEREDLVSSAETQKLTFSGDKTTGALNVDSLATNAKTEHDQSSKQESVLAKEEKKPQKENKVEADGESSVITDMEKESSEKREGTEEGMLSKLASWVTKGLEGADSKDIPDTSKPIEEDDEEVDIDEDNDDEGEDDEEDGDEYEDEDEDELENIKSEPTVNNVKKNDTSINVDDAKVSDPETLDALKSSVGLDEKSVTSEQETELPQNKQVLDESADKKLDTAAESAKENPLDVSSDETQNVDEKMMMNVDEKNKIETHHKKSENLAKQDTEPKTVDSPELKMAEPHTDPKIVSNSKDEKLFEDLVIHNTFNNSDSKGQDTMESEETSINENKVPMKDSTIDKDISEEVEIGGSSSETPASNSNTDTDSASQKDSAAKSPDIEPLKERVSPMDINNLATNLTDSEVGDSEKPKIQEKRSADKETAKVSDSLSNTKELPIAQLPEGEPTIADTPLTEEQATEAPDTKESVTEASDSKIPIIETSASEIPVMEAPTTINPITEVPNEIPQPLDVFSETVTPDPKSSVESTESIYDTKSTSETNDDSPTHDVKTALPNVLPMFSQQMIQQQAYTADVKKTENAEHNAKEELVQKDINSDVPLHTHNLEDVIAESNKKEAEPMQEYKSAEEPPNSNENTEYIKQQVPETSTEYSAEQFSVEDSTEQIQSSAEDGANTPGLFNSIYSYFGAGSANTQKESEEETSAEDPVSYKQMDQKFTATKEENQPLVEDDLLSPDKYCDDDPLSPYCRQKEQGAPESPPEAPESTSEGGATMEMTWTMFTSDIFTYLVTTAVSVIVFLIGYVLLDNSKKVGPLIAKLNKLEKDYLICLKENQILQEKVEGTTIDNLINTVPNSVVDELQQELAEMQNAKTALEEQVQALEKELENSTEVGMELNKLLSEIMTSQSGSDTLQANIEQLQRQLVEQQSTINTVNETLNVKDTENHELHLELEISNKKVVELQSELDKLLLNILKIEEEKDLQQNALETQVNMYKQKYEQISSTLSSREDTFKNDIQSLRLELSSVQRNLELKTKENAILKENFEATQNSKDSAETVKSLVNVSAIKAELEQLKSESQAYVGRLRQEEETRYSLEKKLQSLLDESSKLKEKYDQVDKEKLEAQTKLEVLSNYFKEKEAQMQKELSKHESMWMEKQGEASSTVERIKFMQEELQNCKSQNEALKQEILSQEVELKSQISVLEKKVSENWVMYRQAERRLEDAKQEAAQLRNRLTQRERALTEDKAQNRLDQNGELPMSPIHMDGGGGPSASSPPPPLLPFGGGSREHLAGSPPFLPPLPPPAFMPPPLPGMPPPPFLPPPPHHAHHLPPHHAAHHHGPAPFPPGDHRPPPLGRMSSPPPPPLAARYSPPYSPYDRDTPPSPLYDSEYDKGGVSPAPPGAFHAYDRRQEYKRPVPHHQGGGASAAVGGGGRSNGRSHRGTASSGGSGHSNESIDRLNQHSKV